jgi:hypothetical protein
MFMALSCSKLASNFIPTSYQTRSWKWFRKDMTKSLKVEYFLLSSSIYHLAGPLLRARWNKHNQIESSLSDLDEHHKWNVVMWSCGSLPLFPWKLGMFEGILVGTTCQLGSWWMGSFINLDNYRKCSVARNGNWGCIIDWLAVWKEGPRLKLAPGFHK